MAHPAQFTLARATASTPAGTSKQPDECQDDVLLSLFLLLSIEIRGQGAESLLLLVSWLRSLGSRYRSCNIVA